MKSFSRLMVLGMGLAMLAQAASAEEAAAPSAEDKAAADKAAMMEKMKVAMSPNENHKVLEPLAGKWTTTAKFWMSPDAPAEESAGTSDAEIVYGGRFLKETYKGTWNGEPFEGVGYTGYDNVKGEYTSVWLDNMATGFMTAAGRYDAATKTLAVNGSASCPITGEKDRKMRMETVITDSDHHTMSSYGNDPATGKEFKAMEIVYTRAT